MTPYHLQANGLVEAFNKILGNALRKLCMNDKSDWNDKVYAVLWAYRTTYKKGTGYTPFQLVYGLEAIVPIKFVVPSLRISCLMRWDDQKLLEERLMNLN